MIIVMSHTATDAEIKAVVDRVEEIGLKSELSRGEERTLVGVIGGNAYAYKDAFSHLGGIHEIIPITKPFKLASREFRRNDTIVDVGGLKIGSDEVVVMAGPCSVEGEEMLLETARHVAAQGARVLRGGAFKPRTSPYSFQGLGEEGLEILARVREEFDLPVVTEAIDEASLKLVDAYADCIQIGARNMQNFSLLKAAGRSSKPVLLKRGMSATLDELLMAAEYIMSEGNYNVVLCERGVRTFADHTRNTLDLSVIPAIKRISHLPILADPSHGTGKRNKVAPMSRAAIAAGADGVIIEVHHKPEEALSDGPQSIVPEAFAQIVREVDAIAQVVGRSLQPALAAS